MLILTRRLGESVVIDEHITVTVLAIRGGSVRLGIVAPAEIQILRDELVPHAPVIATGANRLSTRASGIEEM